MRNPKSVRFLPWVSFTLLVYSVSPAAASPADFLALRAKAEKGNAVAQYNLGLAYAQGQDVGVDLARAYVWLTLAADRGMTGQALQQVRARLSDDERAQANILLEQLKVQSSPVTAGTEALPRERAKAEKPALKDEMPAPASTKHDDQVAAATNRNAAEPARANAIVSTTPSEPRFPNGASNADDRTQLADELALAWRDLKQNDAALHSAAAELSTLRGRLAASEARAAEAQAAVAQLTTLRAQLRALENDRVALNAAKNQANERATHVAGENESLMKRVTQAEAALRRFEDRPAAKDTTVDLAAAQHEATAAQAALREDRIALGETKTALAQARAKLDETTAQAAKLQEDIARLTTVGLASTQTLKTELAESHRENVALKEKAVALAAEVSAVREVATGTGARVLQLQNELATVGADKKQLSEELALAWKESETMKQDAKSSSTQLAAFRAQLGTSAEQFAHLQEQLRQANAGLASAAEKSAAFEKAAAEQARSLQNVSTALASANAALAEERSAKETSVNTARQLALDVEAARRDVRASEQAAAENATKLLSATTSLNGAKQELAVMADETSRLKQQLAATETALQNNRQASEQLAAAQDQLKALRTQLATSETKVAEAGANSEQVAVLRTRVKALESERAKLVGDQRSVTAQVAQLTTENERLQQTLSKQPDAAEFARAHAREIAQLKESSSARVAALETRLHTTEAERVSMEQHATKAAAQLVETETRVADLQHKIAVSSQAYAKLQTENDRFKASQSLASNESTTIATKMAAIQQQLDAARVSEASSRRELEAASAKLTVSSAALASLETRLARAEATAREKTTLVASLTERINGIEQQLTEQQKESARVAIAANANLELRSTVAALQQQIAAAQASEAAAKREAELAATKLNNSGASFTALQSRLEQAETAAREKAAGATTLNERLVGLEQKLALQQSEATRVDAAIAADADAKLAMALRSYQLAQDELNASKAEATRLAAEKFTLNGELADAKRALPLAAQAQELRDQLRQTQAQTVALAAENARLKTAIALGTSAPTNVTPSRMASRPTTSETTFASSKSESAPTKTEPRLHTVVAGDTLTRIAAQYYGNPNRWSDVLAANTDVIRNERALVIGRTLRLP